ncbi:hypothetical protein A3746_14875 [Oleibacter sp. HI0075]|nr:hypothetical protein A3746_14875 [Oleibacter sp. HI0075]
MADMKEPLKTEGTRVSDPLMLFKCSANDNVWKRFKNRHRAHKNCHKNRSDEVSPLPAAL